MMKELKESIYCLLQLQYKNISFCVDSITINGENIFVAVFFFNCHLVHTILVCFLYFNIS